MPKNYFNFIQYDDKTKLPLYSRYNFDFINYNTDKKLNIDITPSKFGKLVGLSEITINRITNEIKEILLNEE